MQALSTPIYTEEEQKELVKLYKNLLRKAKPVLKEGDAKIMREAFKFAVEAHQHMRRRSGEPFIYHPIAVATICVEEIGLGTTSIVAALLHDVVEDTEYTLEDIESRFGPTVKDLVAGLTKIAISSYKTTSIQAENFRKMLLTISQDIRVVIIKLADRLHNMRTLDSMPRDKKLKIASETEYVYAPLAHRFGLYAIKSELEDLYLKYANPEAHLNVVKNLKNSKAARDRFIRIFKRPIEEDLRSSQFNFTIKARTKSIRSIHNKMRKQNITFDEVYDLFAIRIIVDAPHHEEKAACWQIYSIVTDHYTPNVERLRDWISFPKSNGYESLHTTVMSKSGQWVEVQIRSKRMDDIAEKGYAAHWKYKEVGETNSEVGLDAWLSKVRELLDNNELNAVEFIDDFRSNLFQDEVFVFTPKGDMKVLSAGATVLDFAFDIHTEVGARCLGAKVNGKLVPLNHKIQNGDQIEIITAKKNKAVEGWLKLVVTSKARSKIKEFLKEEKKIIANNGKEIIQRKLKHLKLPFNHNTVTQMMEYFNVKAENELYYNIGSGLIEHNEIKKFYDNKTKQEEPSTLKVSDPKELKKEIKKLRDGASDELVIGDSSLKGIEYSLAKCCSPIPGDNIFGFATSTNGIKIHRSDCPNASALLANYGYRIIKAKWSAKSSKKEFDARLHIEGTDRVGIITDISRIISSFYSVNIKNIHLDTDSSIFTGDLTLSIHDKNEMEKLVQNIEHIEGVIKVVRVEDSQV